MKKTNLFASSKALSILMLVFGMLIIPLLGYGQTNNDSLLKIWNDLKLPKNIRANAYNQFISNEYLETQTDSAYILAKQLQQFTLNNNLKLEYANVLTTLGNVHFIIGNNNEATNNFQESLKYFKELKDKKGEAEALNNIGKMYKINWQLDEALNYYNESLAISKMINDTTLLINNYLNVGNVYNTRFKVDEALEYYLKSLELSKAINNKRNEAIVYINLGHNYSIRKDYDKAINYLNKSISISQNIGNTLLQANALKNMAQSYFVQRNYDKVIEYSKKCLVLSEKISNKPLQKDSYYFLYEGYRGKKNFKMAIDYMEKLKIFEDGEQEVETEKQLQNIKISKIRLEDSLLQQKQHFESNLKHNLEIQQKDKEKSNLAFGLGGSLIAMLFIVFFGYKNVKRKQLITEQEREIEIQKKDKKLKDLELQAIDAMILGQEKERQRMASDLHDNIGATLSAAKLQFNYLIDKKGDIEDTNELTKKISALLEDAYVEVRSMAHLKNSGVMAKNGLLPAIKKLAKNASDNDNFQIEVHSFGLDQRLDNSLEIAIFRIIQELVTNIIKHAEASEANIHITNHEDSLNIMVEDNGKGFNPNQITKTNKGMGISSIGKRIEHLNGTMTIESEINKGTTVIIDIPL